MIGDGILFGTEGRTNERAGMGKLSGHAVLELSILLQYDRIGLDHP